MPKPQIELRNINKSFKRQSGEKIIGLEAINLTINKGEVFGIIGTNGAGKSTLLNVLTGQVLIDSGEIYLNDKRIDHLKPIEYVNFISRVFQDPRMGTAPRMTVFENLMLADKRGQSRLFNRSLNESNRQRMIDKLAPFKLNLEERLDVPIEDLSGGQRQAVALVMATLQTPELLLLDEHTAALDPRTARSVMTMTEQVIQQYGLTAIMITHQLQDAIQYCDRIGVMHRGQFVKIYSPEEIQKLSSADLYTHLESLIELELEA